jgi:hypothetical protein
MPAGAFVLGCTKRALLVTAFVVYLEGPFRDTFKSFVATCLQVRLF